MMRRNRIKFIIKLFLFCLLLVMLLGACTPKSQVTHVPEQEVAELREQFPYNDAVSGIAAGVSIDSLFPTFEKVVKEHDYHSVAVLKFTGDWYTISNKVSVYDDEEMNRIIEQKNPSISNLTYPVIDAVIVDVLWAGSDLKPGDVVTIIFAADVIVNGMNLQATYKDQQAVVCCMKDDRDLHKGHDKPIFATSKESSWYLTDKNIILSVTSAPGPDSVSGMYLDAFTTLVNETLGPPDAELTPVEPELEVE